jgi:hypothetical protein
MILKAGCGEAVGRLSVYAVEAGAAGREHHDHSVSGLEFFHSIPRARDNSCTLVSIDGRVRDRKISVPGMHVRLTDPAGYDPDQQFANSRLGKLNPLDMERAAPLVNDGCCDLHRFSLPTAIYFFESFEIILGSPLGVKEI